MHDKHELTAEIARLRRELKRVSTEAVWGFHAQSQVPTYLVDACGAIVECNEALERLTGYSRRELSDMDTALHLVFPDPQYRAHIESMIRQERTRPSVVTRYHAVIIRKDGVSRTVEFSAFSTTDGCYRVIQAVDVTDRYILDHAKTQTDERCRLFLENLQGIAFVSADASGAPLSIYGKVREITGYSPEDWIEKRVNWETVIHREDIGSVRDAFADVLSSRRDINKEFRMLRPDGEQRWLRLIGNALGGGAELPKFFQGILFDITEFKELTTRIEHQQQQLAQTDKLASLGILVSGVAHEVNNPNHYILSNAEMLWKIWSDVTPHIAGNAEKLKDIAIGNMTTSQLYENIPLLIEGIIDGAERIREIVRELGDYSRKSTLEMTDRVDINLVVQSALPLLSNMIKKATRRFSLDLGDGIPTFKGNGRRLEQVVVNLVMNACQALPDPERAVRIVTRYDRENEAVILSVEDEGVGIPEFDLPHITDPFFTTKRETKGTGLGLSIAIKIARDHRGNLLFHSNVGEGTTVTLILPAGRPADTLPSVRNSRRAKTFRMPG